ncbi:FAD-dependent oxidoreductase [Nostoc sp. DedQUE09]|uniref:FAD-dependent oxidoreductase n=1 Tax=Nostoc sp. DedQUE09 TaxID=3075394 RepID=UPI002AD3ECB9|nr:FAD-dependent oxidoreductase [Nostoc sp. DedQUE09]MDZ7955332.1 FAD-dependent oxidoreductase [Nostoc sp. DedQUE09]
MSKIVVLGAGPAGCSAGYHLAKSGHQVMLIDKDCFPRDKTCGDGVSLGSVQALSTIRLFNEFVERNQATKELLSLVVSQQKPKAYPLATAKRANTVSDGKVFKIGDAANLTDPLTGEGIANAILSGLYVTQAINMSTSPELASENWQRLYQLYFEPDLDAGLQIKSFRKFSFINKLLIWLMNRNKPLAEQVTYTFAGLIPYKKLLP